MSLRDLPSGKRLALARRLKGFNQDDIIVAEGFPLIDVRTLRRWEKTGIPQKRIGEIAEFFGLEISSFFAHEITKEDFETIIFNPELQKTILAQPSSNEKIEETLKTHSSPQANEKIQDLEQWQKIIIRKITAINPSQKMMESFHFLASAEDKDHILGLNPLLHDWPHRFLSQNWPGINLSIPSKIGPDLSHANVAQKFPEKTSILQDLPKGLTLLRGEPGIGKTAAIQDIARRCILEEKGLIPLFISLPDYYQQKQSNTSKNLLEFSLGQVGIMEPRQIQLWENILEQLSLEPDPSVLFLLDGWDNLPVSERELFLHEITLFSEKFPTLITVRFSTPSWYFRSSRSFQMSQFPPDKINYFIQQWFQELGHPEKTEQFQDYLTVHPDFARLAQSPFLLSVLCKISFDKENEYRSAFPRNQYQLYHSIIHHLFQSHTFSFPNRPFSSKHVRQLSLMALKLKETEKEKQYSFDTGDVYDCLGNPDVWEKWIKPSRFVSQSPENHDSHHFLFPEFHDFLAAEAFLFPKEEDIREKIQTHIYDFRWQRVFLFIAGNPKQTTNIFWEEMRKIAQQPDRFGWLTLFLSQCIIERGETDGGKALLGIDLREEINSSVFKSLLKKWDFPYYLIHENTKGGKRALSQKEKFLLLSPRTKSHEFSKALIQTLLEENKELTPQTARELALEIDVKGIHTLRETLLSPTTSMILKKRILSVLGKVQDRGCVEQIISLLQKSPDLEPKILYTLGEINSEKARKELHERVDKKESIDSFLIEALGNTQSIEFLPVLLQQWKKNQPSDHSRKEDLLKALKKFPLHYDEEILLEFFKSSQKEEIKESILEVLNKGKGKTFRDIFLYLFQQEKNKNIRIKLLDCLLDRSEPEDFTWLKILIEDKQEELGVRKKALEMLAMIVSRFSHQEEGFSISNQIKELFLQLLTPKGDLALSVTKYSELFGTSTGPRLIEILSSSEFSEENKILSCQILGKIKYHEAVKEFVKIIETHPGFSKEASSQPKKYGIPLYQAALSSLCQIDLSVIFEILKKKPIQETLEKMIYDNIAHYAYDTQSWFFPDRVISSQGKIILTLPQ